MYQGYSGLPRIAWAQSQLQSCLNLLANVRFKTPYKLSPGLHKENKEKKEKGGLNQGPWGTALILNQFTSELLHIVLHLIN